MTWRLGTLTNQKDFPSPTHDSDDDDATLTPSIIAESGERSLLMPARRTETNPFEGHVGAVPIDESRTLRDIAGSEPRQSSSPPGDKKAHARLKLALAREPDDEDLPRRRSVHGLTPPAAREGAAQGDERNSRPFSKDKDTLIAWNWLQPENKGPKT